VSRAIGLAAAAALCAAVSVAPQKQALAITAVTVIDVIHGRTLPNSTVVIADGVVASITQGGTSPAGARIVDGRGRFLIPGLWDMHAHMEAAGASWLQLYLANGVTGIRDMGSDLDTILNMREATASGRTPGPRIFAAGPILDDAPGDWPFRMRVRTAEEGTAAVRLLKRRGVDLIKVHDHTPHDAFFAIAAEARRQHLPLAGHIPLGLTAEQVIDAGQGDIEHLSNLQLWRPCSGGQEYSAERCRPFFDMLARKRIWQTPTLVASSEIATIGTPASAVPADRMAYASKSLREMWAGNQSLVTDPNVPRIMRARAETGAIVTKDMAQIGVPILAGCDSMIAGFCVHDELAAMVRGGMTPLAALQTATINPARYFGIESSTGDVARGGRADLVLLDANPLIDIGAVGRIHAVVLAGRLFDRAELNRMLAEVKAAAGRSRI